MSDKTKLVSSAPAYCSHNKAWVNWIEDGISKKHIKHYDYNGFSNLKVISSGSFGKVYRAHWKNFRNILALKTLNDSTAEKVVYEVRYTLYISVFVKNTFLIFLIKNFFLSLA